MRQLLPALVVAVLGFSSAKADPPAAPKPSPFSNKSFGDGGGYKHPDSEVSDYFESKPQKPAELKPERPGKIEPAKAEPAKPEPAKPQPAAAKPIKINPDIRPVADIPSRPRPRPFAVPAAEKLNDAPAAAKTDAPQPPKASAATVTGGSDDAASDDARRDYEARLFGAPAAPRHPGLAGDEKVLPLTDPATASSTGEGMLFVSLELDAKEAGSLRDAVAGLGAAAAFRPDARFQPLPGEAGSVRISGWLPVSRLGDAIARPGVKRVAVERGNRPAGDERLTGDYLLKLRVTDPGNPEASIAASVRDLAFQTGFKLDRVFGFETVPGSGATAFVSGTMPVSRLSKALGMPDVVKVSSALSPAETATEAAAAAKPAVQKEGFLKYAMTRSLWLVLLTVLLALPTIGDVVKRGLSVFVPYR